MIYSGILVLILNSCLDKAGIFRFGFFAVLFSFLVGVMKMPRHKDILSRKLPMLLLIGPDIDQHSATDLDDPKHLR